MADIIRAQNAGIPNDMETRYVEMADGTYAQLVAAVLLNPAASAEGGAGGAGGVGGAAAAGQPLLTDEAVGALAVIDTAHYEVHEGRSFLSDAVGIASQIILAFRTPNSDARIHLIVEFESEDAAHLELHEAPTWTVGTGNRHPVYNRDRNSANQSVVLENTTVANLASGNLVLDPANLAGGNVIHDLWAWSNKQETVKTRDKDEIVLRLDTQYAVRLVSDAGNRGLHIILNWYEEGVD